MKRDTITVVVFLLLAVFALTAEYCAFSPMPDQDGTLVPLVWSEVPQLKRECVSCAGENNLVRPVMFDKDVPCIELSSGGGGRIEYRTDLQRLPDYDCCWRIMFLSMQGNGRVEIRALDAANKILMTSSYDFSGAILNSGRKKMHSERSRFNYTGNWIEENHNIGRLLDTDFSSCSGKIVRLEMALIVENGQHALVEEFGFCRNYRQTLLITVPKNITALKGETIHPEITVKNIGNSDVDNADLELSVPYAAGVVPEERLPRLTLARGQTQVLPLALKALRSNAVNLDHPWEITLSVNGQACSGFNVSVEDNTPGKLFYVLTDDLEVIDAAGYPGKWGEKSGWITADEILVQMKNKAERINGIAAAHGARWTHYIAWPLIRAAAEMNVAGCQGWSDVISEIRESVRTQSAAGHEYGLHMHSDYDPRLPGNSLSINYQLNAFWGNHMRHGWAHSIKETGNFSEYDTRAGILFSYLGELQRLTAAAPAGSSITSRAGSFDFGVGAEDQLRSYLAYKKTGLLGSSDAPGNIGGQAAAAFGREIYLARPDAIEQPAASLQDVGLVEFIPTPLKRIEYDLDSLPDLNRKVDEGVAAFNKNGKIAPGVHAITGFTHAMFLLGDGDWQSLNGGMFDKLDAHLEYCASRYVEAGLLQFATASNLVAEYLDYYTPEPLALTGQLVRDEAGVAEYNVRILGSDIPADRNYRYQLALKYPLWLRNQAYCAAIYKNGRAVAIFNDLPLPDNDLHFLYDDKSAKYTLRIWYGKYIFGILKLLRPVTAAA